MPGAGSGAARGHLGPHPCQLGRPVALDHVDDVTLAVIGLGAWGEGMSTIHAVLSDAERTAVTDAGAVGEAAGVFFGADGAVVEGAIMLARTVVRLAETSTERDRVLERQERRAS